MTVSRLIAAALIVLWCSPAFGATYYIDFDSGSDTNAGTSTGAAWKTIPGTRNAEDTADQSTCWGSGCPGSPTISSSNKVQAGDIIYLKGGTTHSSADGGKILIDADYYVNTATVAAPIKIWKDTGWGTGTVTIDGTGIAVSTGPYYSGFGLIHITVPGIEIDGKETDGITIQDSWVHAISFYISTDTEGVTLKYLKTSACGEYYETDSAASASGHIYIRSANSGSASYINMDGIDKTTGHFSNGMMFGSDAPTRVYNFTVSNVNAYNLHGDTSTDDAGIGFKALNSSITFNDCTSYDNLKGFDLGHDGSPTWAFTYTVNRATVYNNAWGINGNGPHAAYAYDIKFYVTNSIVYDNSVFGSKFYSGPYKLYMAHNVYHGNGSGDAYNSGNLAAGPDTTNADDTYDIDVYLYNNAFYKPAGSRANYQVLLWRVGETNPSDFTLTSDYNSWIQADGATDDFAYWGANAGSDESPTFAYGANGPGNASGNWYSWYGGSTTVPTPSECLGHYHADSHSFATGGADSTAPPFANAASHDYTLTTTYTGTNISGESWYIAAMGTDRAGNARSGWDIGAYEYDASPPAGSGGLTLGSGGTMSIGSGGTITLQ